MCETGMVLSELSFMIRHTKKFARKHRVMTPLAQFHASSYQMPCPLWSCFGHVSLELSVYVNH